jgi:hypothetical protein
MKLRLSKTIEVQSQRGFWLRYFLEIERQFANQNLIQGALNCHGFQSRGVVV